MRMLQTKIEGLEKENKALKASQEEMKADVAIVSDELKALLEEVGLDDILTPQDGQLQVDKGDIIKIFGKLTLKFTTGKIKVSDLQNRWERLSPVLMKYSYLLEQ